MQRYQKGKTTKKGEVFHIVLREINLDLVPVEKEMN